MVRGLFFWFCLSLTASTATADVATIENCVVSRPQNLRPSFSCDVTNHSATAIAWIGFKASIYTPGRSVPWDVIGRYEHEHTPISGGIEQNETLNLEFSKVYYPKRAADNVIEVEIMDAIFLDVDRNQIIE